MVIVTRRRRFTRTTVRRRRLPDPKKNNLYTFDTMVYHGKELVGNFPTGNGAFVNALAEINPALTSQLSTLGALFSEYRFTKMRFVFVSEETQNSNLGTVYMSYSNDITAVAPTAISDVTQRALSIRFPLAQTNSLSLQESMDNPRRSFPNVLDVPRSYNRYEWFRTNTSGGLSDTNTSGLLFFGDNGVANGNTPGALYFMYTIVFRSHL